MSHAYKAVGWNRQKKVYDLTLTFGVVLYLGLFVGLGATLFPNSTIETLLIRAFGTGAFFLLHVILSIGPLARLDRRFLPLLYNRRHLGVTMFLMGLVHGLFSIVQFHALGDRNPLVSVLTSEGGSVAEGFSSFPFQPLGLAALVILFLMAATSHDFWLANLSAPGCGKRLHHARVRRLRPRSSVHVVSRRPPGRTERHWLYPILLGRRCDAWVRHACTWPRRTGAKGQGHLSLEATAEAGWIRRACGRVSDIEA